MRISKLKLRIMSAIFSLTAFLLWDSSTTTMPYAPPEMMGKPQFRTDWALLAVAIGCALLAILTFLLSLTKITEERQK